MRKQTRALSPIAIIIITPLVDVALTLLLIFLVAVPIIQTSMSIELPKTKTRGEEMVVKWTITITKENNVFLNDRLVSFDELERRLKIIAAGRKDIEVYLKADKRVQYGFVVEIMDMVKKSGIENLGIVTEPE